MRSHIRGLWATKAVILLFVAGCIEPQAFGQVASVAPLTVRDLLGDTVENPDAPEYRPVADAIEKFNSGDFAAARGLLIKLRQNESEIPPADLMMARMLLLRGDRATASSALESAVMIEPEHPHAYLLLSELSLTDGHLAAAQLLALHALERVKQASLREQYADGLIQESHVTLANVSLARRDWESAETKSRQILQHWPKLQLAQQILARSLFFQQEFQEAYQVLQTSWQDHPASPRAEIQMAWMYEELATQGQKEKHASARRAMLQAAQQGADDYLNRLLVAQWGLQTFEIDIADANARAALQLEPESVEAQTLMGFVARHQRDFAAAEKAFEIVLKSVPDNTLAISQLALCLAGQDAREKRERAKQVAAELYQPNVLSTISARDAAITFAWTQFRLGEVDDATQLVKQVIRSGAVSDESAYFAAEILTATGEKDVARETLRAAIANRRCFPTHKQAQALWEHLESTVTATGSP